MSDKEIFEKVYEKAEDRWTKIEPPNELVELIETRRIKPCKVIDIGCGRGYYSIYLASKGFDVLGIDLSKRAIQYARENAVKHKVNVRFMQMGITNLSKLKEKFNLVLEFGVLHHIMPQQRQKYVEDVNKLLNFDGKYLSVCFNEQSPEFGGAGKKYRESPLGTRIYYSSQDELRELFEQHFRIIEAKIITMVGGKGQPHVGNYFFMERL